MREERETERVEAFSGGVFGADPQVNAVCRILATSLETVSGVFD
jgi:hypothetical protein